VFFAAGDVHDHEWNCSKPLGEDYNAYKNSLSIIENRGAK